MNGLGPSFAQPATHASAISFRCFPPRWRRSHVGCVASLSLGGGCPSGLKDAQGTFPQYRVFPRQPGRRSCWAHTGHTSPEPFLRWAPLAPLGSATAETAGFPCGVRRPSPGKAGGLGCRRLPAPRVLAFAGHP